MFIIPSLATCIWLREIQVAQHDNIILVSREEVLIDKPVVVNK